MRTTVSINDDLLEDAKRRAADEGRTLGELISEALRERLARSPATEPARYSALAFGEGGTLAGVDITSNAGLRDLMDQA